MKKRLSFKQFATDNMMILIITAMVYILSYIYQINYKAYYGIPDWFVEIDIPTLIESGVLVILPIMVIILMFMYFFIYLYNGLNSPIMRWMFRFFVVSISFRLLTIKGIKEISVILSITVLLVMIELIILPIMSVNRFIRKRHRIIRMIKFKFKNGKKTPIDLVLLCTSIYEFLLGRGQRALKKLFFTNFPFKKLSKEYITLLKGIVIAIYFFFISVNLGYLTASTEDNFKVLSVHSNNYVILGTYQDYLITAKVDLKRNIIISKDFYLINKAPSKELNITVFNIHKHLGVKRSDKITISTIN